MSSKPTKPVRSQSLRERAKGNRQMSDIVVETYTDFEAAAAVGTASTASSSKEPSPSIDSSSLSSRRSTKDSTPLDGVASDTINFYSGNPFVEVTKGILHLYKENSTTSLEEGVIRSHMICKNFLQKKCCPFLCHFYRCFFQACWAFRPSTKPPTSCSSWPRATRSWK